MPGPASTTVLPKLVMFNCKPIVWVLAEKLVIIPFTTTEFPLNVKALALLLNWMPVKTLPPVKLRLLLFATVLPEKTRESFKTGATPPTQFAPVPQFESAPPPTHVLLAPEAGLVANGVMNGAAIKSARADVIFFIFSKLFETRDEPGQ